MPHKVYILKMTRLHHTNLADKRITMLRYLYLPLLCKTVLRHLSALTVLFLCFSHFSFPLFVCFPIEVGRVHLPCSKKLINNLFRIGMRIYKELDKKNEQSRIDSVFNSSKSHMRSAHHKLELVTPSSERKNLMNR